MYRTPGWKTKEKKIVQDALLELVLIEGLFNFCSVCKEHPVKKRKTKFVQDALLELVLIEGLFNFCSVCKEHPV